MNNTAKRIKKYKELKADIVDIDIRLEDKEDKQLLEVRRAKELEVRRIENALTVLTDPHKEIIEEVLINNRNYSYMQERLNLSYSRVKQLEGIALKKMQKYLP
ncbi:sigma factor-like helix-turn-helix DNA-binding protein [Clostridium paraputrificum]|jgi:DNA-directed RNA polymerase specialized sigma24 family protein|uniref:sigma factor-like helix-turn-helix DNA-binding protein n=1 Tax=Clostridium paraputrificum TaxID=29363 RepID=UPI00189DE1E9|nr:sigma factor-like helix-turn-helix DNA-binding protein [Clostridium paraputrificum]MDB2091398.1 sigma factor-like helix-turn-helix DNA-binding protein [Clostridium paraputrificum]